MKKAEILKEMFSKCGDVIIVKLDNDGNRWRVCKKSLSGRMDWAKCKKILNKKGIEYDEGHDGYGMRMGRCIDFWFREEENNLN
jgi:hypothetical protein